MKTYRSPAQVVSEVESVLAQAHPRPGEDPVLDRIVESLFEGRHYFWVGIYLNIGNRAVRQVFRGPVPPCHSFEFGKGNVGTAGKNGVTKIIPDVSADPTYSMCFTETKSEIVVPIKIGTHVLGIIDAESDKPNAFGSEDRVLLEQVAERLARFLATAGKYITARARRETQPELQRHAPTSEKPGETQARRAAGENS